MGIQTNIEMTTPEKNNYQMIDMDIPLLGMSRQVVKIRFHNMFDVMKSIQHGTLECHTNVFQTKRQFVVGKGPPWENKCRLMLVGQENLNLIVAGESIHEGKNNASGTVVDYLIDIRSGEVGF